MKIPDRKILFLNGVLLVFLLAHSIYRDIQLENQYPGDLRNRVVGARLQKDGKLPYHYHWQTGDGIRYYDPNEDPWPSPTENTDNKIPSTADINKITASPFFHELLSPFCDLPQRTFSRIWLWGQYLLLVCMIGMISGLTGDKGKKWLLFNIGILFTATEAWITLISAGQLYLFTSFLMCCIVTALVRNKKYEIILAGTCAVMLVLIRPIAIVLFIPFLFYYKKYLLFLLSACSGLALYLIFVLISPNEQSLYKDYLNAMKWQIQLHQSANDGLPPTPVSTALQISNIEGFDLAEAKRRSEIYPVKEHSENGNVFVFYFKIFHKKLSLLALNAGMVFTVALLSLLFYFHIRKHPAQILQILLFGLTLYMIVELFTPIYRRQYNTVQWFPMVLTGFLLITDWKSRIFLFMIMGLILNIVNFSGLPMRHTIGEFCWLTGLLLLVFSSKGTLNVKFIAMHDTQ
jgi:hypothetical protein